VNLQHWEAYYRHGGLATCPMGPDSTYTLELRDVWTGFFLSLPDRARVLDIGTGNGAIALMAKEAATSAGRTFEIHGTDLAQIDPVHNVPNGATLFAGISFHAGIATEQLPFQCSSFDTVSGQYAIEYTRVEAALREIHRVLVAGGRAQFILHHDQSVLVRNARESLSQSSLVLEETQILRKLRRFLEAERRSARSVNETWKELTGAVATLQRAAGGAVTAHTLRVTVDAVQKLFDSRKRLSPAVLDREIHLVERELRASARRLIDLVGSGKSADEMRGICVAARTIGFETDDAVPQLHAGANLVGWRLNLTKCS